MAGTQSEARFRVLLKIQKMRYPVEKITSFTINHLKLLPGVYVSRKDRVGSETVTTFDLRMTQPNAEPVMNTAEVHAIEHLGATWLRNHPDWKDQVLYFGPMGCRTGFYLILRDSVSREDALGLCREAFAFAADFTGSIPGARRVECGNYRGHDLPGARREAGAYLAVLDGCGADTMEYPA